MSIHKNIKVAKEMGLSIQYAVNCRRRYLMNELDRLDPLIDYYDNFKGSAVDEYFALMQYSELSLERSKVNLELSTMKRITTSKAEVTDEMIVQSRSYPIERLVDFIRGKATAFCHEDRNPSMYLMTRTNRACCPVCNKTFDSIAVCMDRDGMTFQAAVKYLVGLC